jgi:hypothetical protein
MLMLPQLVVQLLHRSSAPFVAAVASRRTAVAKQLLLPQVKLVKPYTPLMIDVAAWSWSSEV